MGEGEGKGVRDDIDFWLSVRFWYGAWVTGGKGEGGRGGKKRRKMLGVRYSGYGK